MRIALGSDDRTDMTAFLADDLRRRGHDVSLHGALDPLEPKEWPLVGRRVGEAVASGESEYGIVCCWTGTGVSIAANKVRGVRAALCNDAQTAAGARTWNDANVLALSLRSTTPEDARAILDAWFESQPTDDPEDRAMIGRVELPASRRGET